MFTVVIFQGKKVKIRSALNVAGVSLKGLGFGS